MSTLRQFGSVWVARPKGGEVRQFGTSTAAQEYLVPFQARSEPPPPPPPTPKTKAKPKRAIRSRFSRKE
jgi:hypothetical protein